MAGRAELQEREYERSGVLGWLRQGFFPLPAKEDVETKLVREDEVERALDEAPDPVATGALLREQAEHVQSSRDERGRAAEARATTVLGTVPIAASVVLAGAGLTLGENNIPGNWSVLITAIVALLLLLLLICGFTASRAVLKVRIRVTNEPRIRQALEWAADPDAHPVQVKRVMDLVRRADETLYVAEYKRAQLKVAYHWYRAALLCFGLLGIVLVAYALARNNPSVSVGDVLIAAIAALLGATLATAWANYPRKIQTDNADASDQVEIPAGRDREQ